jgi:hypothetical protein
MEFQGIKMGMNKELTSTSSEAIELVKHVEIFKRDKKK